MSKLIAFVVIGAILGFSIVDALFINMSPSAFFLSIVTIWFVSSASFYAGYIQNPVNRKLPDNVRKFG